MQHEMTSLEVSRLAPSEHIEKLLEHTKKNRDELLHSHVRKVAKEWGHEDLLEQPVNTAMPA